MLSERLHEEMQFAISALSGPVVVGDYSVIEQMLRVRAQQPVVAEFTWTDNLGHPVTASGQQIKPEAPRWFTQWLALPFGEQSQEIMGWGNVREGLFAFHPRRVNQQAMARVSAEGWHPVARGWGIPGRNVCGAREWHTAFAGLGLECPPFWPGQLCRPQPRARPTRNSAMYPGVQQHGREHLVLARVAAPKSGETPSARHAG